ncbi:MAG: transposase, partial [Longispora sp.]|nr:transposase [Longispora sp. (in: high G+C Gram-positive bacteria)]
MPLRGRANDYQSQSVTTERETDAELVKQLAAHACAQGLKLAGEGGLLQRFTKVVIESALEGEMDDHLGYGKHERAGRGGEDGEISRSGNARDGVRAKKLLTDIGPVDIEVQRDRDASFEPVIFIDAINVMIRDGQVANRPIYV